MKKKHKQTDLFFLNFYFLWYVNTENFHYLYEWETPLHIIYLK